MAKELFDDFGEMIEKDDVLDVNTILSATPPDSSPKIEGDDDDTKRDPKDKEVPLDVNRVLQDADIDIDDDEIDSSEDLEDEEEIVDEIDKDPRPDDIDDSPSSDAPFTVIFARDLNGRGLLSSFNEEQFLKDIEEKGEANALRSLFQTEVDLNINEAKKDLEAGYQEYLSLIGSGVQAEEAGGLLELKTYFDGVNSETLEEDEELRKEVMTRYYKATTQMSDSKIKRMIERSTDLGDDVEESKEYLETMKGLIVEEIKQSKAQADEQQRLYQVEQDRQLKLLKEGIDSISEIIPGQKINKQTKDKMYESIIKPTQDKFGNTTNEIWATRAEDPVLFDTRLAYLIQTGYFENKPWDKIKKIKTSKEATELEEYLTKSTYSRKGTPITTSIRDKKTRDIIQDTGSILN